MKRAIVIANLGGPDRLEAVEPFLFNLFSDRAILGVPQPFRYLLAKFIAMRRAPVAKEIYDRMGGRSPILPETLAQASALEQALQARAPAGDHNRTFIAMRYWHPFVFEAVREVKAWAPDRIILLPLYPQFSSTTTASFFEAWDEAAARVRLSTPTVRICCHPTDPPFVAAHAGLIRAALEKIPPGRSVRVLFSAHGLPKRVIARGDPYQWQIEETVRAVVRALDNGGLDWRVSYQSRVGPLAWLEPATDTEIKTAGAEGKALIVVPIAFVSEHSETLVELDIDYGRLAAEAGAQPYIRVPALGTAPAYCEGLARLVLDQARTHGIVAAAGRRICPDHCHLCPNPGPRLELHS